MCLLIYHNHQWVLNSWSHSPNAAWAAHLLMILPMRMRNSQNSHVRFDAACLALTTSQSPDCMCVGRFQHGRLRWWYRQPYHDLRNEQHSVYSIETFDRPLANRSVSRSPKHLFRRQGIPSKLFLLKDFFIDWQTLDSGKTWLRSLGWQRMSSSFKYSLPLCSIYSMRYSWRSWGNNDMTARQWQHHLEIISDPVTAAIGIS